MQLQCLQSKGDPKGKNKNILLNFLDNISTKKLKNLSSHYIDKIT